MSAAAFQEIANLYTVYSQSTFVSAQVWTENPNGPQWFGGNLSKIHVTASTNGSCKTTKTNTTKEICGKKI